MDRACDTLDKWLTRLVLYRAWGASSWSKAATAGSSLWGCVGPGVNRRCLSSQRAIQVPPHAHRWWLCIVDCARAARLSMCKSAHDSLAEGRHDTVLHQARRYTPNALLGAKLILEVVQHGVALRAAQLYGLPC